MQQILSYMRRAVTQYGMISNGDHIAIGVSGGKDSLALLTGLARLRSFLGVEFSLTALTLDPGFGGKPTDYSAVAALCKQLDVPYIIKPTNIAEIIFDIRKESNPCSLCARMRRGALHDLAKAHGCNKLALGHNYDDAVETFMMNLFNEGRIGCFRPVTHLSRKDITVIRPLVFAPEKDIVRAVRRAELPVVKSPCPVDKTTNRQTTKLFLLELEKQNPGITKRIFGAMQRAGVDGF